MNNNTKQDELVIDMVAIERDARYARAMAMRDTATAFRAWVKGLFGARPVAASGSGAA